VSEATLKSTVFRKERESKWRALESLVGRVERHGIHNLSSEETLKLQSLYRVALSSLSVARNISLDQAVLTYLEALSARAYFCVYGPRERFFTVFLTFFQRQFPAAIRALSGPIFLSAAVLFAGIGTGFALTFNELDWFYAFVSEDMASGRTPTTPAEDLKAGLFSTHASVKDKLHVFASFLFTHNAKIGFLAFALGFAFGIPTVILLFYNGLALGAFIALFVSKSLGVEFLGWLTIHGTTELLAVIICGGAGLAIGGAAIFPRRRTRLNSLTHQGRMSGLIVIGTVILFFAAGILEGFGRQLIVSTVDRYLIGATALALWLAYFLSSGKGRQ
jgi:uncharacterized membrane protein SpoIIM required for sporulation